MLHESDSFTGPSSVTKSVYIIDPLEKVRSVITSDKLYGIV